MKVLVVDDSAVTRGIIRRTISASGLAVSAVAEAEDGRSAIRALATDGADLLITDLNMPGMGGVELVRAVRNDPVLAASPSWWCRPTPAPRGAR
jgi:two-component system chemotaxis response regulator CheY